MTTAAPAGHWVHDLDPFLLRFPDNPLGLEGIRYYGLAYLLGFLGAWGLLRVYHAKGRIRLDADDRASLMTALIVGILVGGRVGYMLLYDLGDFLHNPLLLVRIDRGGMASHGGFAGGVLGLLWFARSRRRPLLVLGDIAATVAPLGLTLGRVANFINGELWGRPSTLPWAVVFPESPPAYDPATGFLGPEPRHPSQLYEAGLEGLALLAWTQWRFWRGGAAPGHIAGEFLVGYALLRIAGEIFREPDAPLLLGLNRGQFYSLFLLLGGIAVLVAARRHRAAAN
jgi:phosphatidylglycerol:prolipoprotein diacylglycerol transferase